MNEMVEAPFAGHDKGRIIGRITAEYFRNGKKFAEDVVENTLTLDGLNNVLDATFGVVVGGSNWYVVPLKAGTPTESWDETNLGAGPGNEFLNYSEATRPAWTGVRTDQTISNTASKAKITINADTQTLTGAGLTTQSGKGSQVAMLFAAGNFAASRTGLMTGDEVYLTYEITAANG